MSSAQAGQIAGKLLAMSTSARPSSIEVFTDGACKGNPGPGGWAWAVAPEGHPRGFGGERQSTNQRMEIMAALEALRTLTGAFTVVSDSTYVVNCVNNKWYLNWRRNGWKNSQKQPVANQDLWKPMFELYDPTRHTFRWVKGHSGNRMNDLVDQLAVAASNGPFEQNALPPPTPDPAAPPSTLF